MEGLAHLRQRRCDHSAVEIFREECVCYEIAMRDALRGGSDIYIGTLRRLGGAQAKVGSPGYLTLPAE